MLRLAWPRQSQRQHHVDTKPTDATNQPAYSPSMIEPLEPRSLLSWPPVAAVAGHSDKTIYVNQNGVAILPNQRINPGQGFQSDQIYFDDSGKLSIQAFSRVPLDTAFYTADRSRPAQVNTTPNSRSSGLLVGNVSPEKDTLYLAVRTHALAHAATYTLVVHGVPSAFIQPISLSPSNDTGSAGSDISGTNDYDVYRFTTSRAGNWTVRVTPTPVPDQYPQRLDATMNIYNRKGRPVLGGGSFTAPINQHGPGATETWFGTNLPAHTTYYIRIDGQADSIGKYRVSVTGP
ncbi:MAG: hypothetical protein ACM359_21520 [Bacillota bacterium]